MSNETIIIGAGLSGLAAGIRLAYFDQPVCILEKHTTIGGLNSFYRLRQRDFDVGLHAVTNYAAPGTKTGPLSKLLRQLRLRWDDFDLSPQTGSRIAFPGITLRFSNDFELLRQEIADHFPWQKDGFAKLLARVDAHDELDLGQGAASARAVLRECLTDPLLIDMLLCPLMFYGSATPHDMDFNQFVVMFKAIYYEGFGRPFEGVRLIMKKLTRKFKELGGKLRLRAGVREIQADARRVVGVVLEDGETLPARNVLSSAGFYETMQLCQPRPAEPDVGEAGNISFVETISVLDRQPAELDHTSTIVFYNDSDRFTYANPDQPVDLRSGIVCSPNNFQYPQPLAEGVIRLTALANHAHWLNLPEPDYTAQKERWCAEMIQAALRFIPDFRSHIVDTDVFTPRTIRKFTGHVNGCVYGAPQKHLMGTTHLENLFICGTDQGYLGIIGAMLSGITVANLHLLKPT